MFEALNLRAGPGLFSASRRTPRPSLEKLEDRDVPALIAGCVYADANGNGVQDTGESGLANSTIQLFDGNNQLVGTTVTDGMGMYQFTRNGGPPPGPAQQAHELSFDLARTNVTRGGTLPMFDPALGTLTSVEIIAEGNLQSKVLLENLDAGPADMEAELKGSLRFTVNGQALTASPTQTLQTAVAAFDGQTDFAGASARDFGVTQLNGSFQTLTLSSPSDLAAFVGGGPVGVTQDARMESCVCGTGNLMSMVTSMGQGKVKLVYHYQPGNDLGPGTYRVVQTSQPAGFIDGVDSRGGVPIAGSHKSDAITVGVVGPSDQSLNNCFGEVRPSALSGHVYHDVNRNGVFSLGDRFLAGVRVFLVGTDMFGDRVVRQAATNAGGFYAFGGLVAGTYTVREAQPVGYLQGANNPGSRGGTVAGDSITMRLEQATNAINYNFGELLPPTTPRNPIVTGGLPSKTAYMGVSRYKWAW